MDIKSILNYHYLFKKRLALCLQPQHHHTEEWYAEINRLLATNHHDDPQIELLIQRGGPCPLNHVSTSVTTI